MAVFKTVVLVFQILTGLGLISTIILQSGKSAGLSGAITGGAETIFGKKKGMDDFFSKISTILAVAFMILTLVIALLQARPV